jgi:hypothetical protein
LNPGFFNLFLSFLKEQGIELNISPLKAAILAKNMMMVSFSETIFLACQGPPQVAPDRLG